MVTQSTQEQREAGQAVHHDHDNGEHRVAGKRRIGFARQHHRANGHDLDTADAEREDKCAVRFAQYDRELVGIGDHGQGADDNRDKQPHEDCDACRGPEIRRQQLLTEEEEERGGAEDEEERERSANRGSSRFRRGA